MLCIHLLTQLREQIWVKAMYFNVVDNFNHILQNTVKFRWHFFASQHFAMDDAMCRLTFESNLFDLTSETIKPSIHGSCSIHINTDKKWPVQFSWYVVIQRLAAVVLVGNKSAHNVSLCTSSWKIYCMKTSIIALLSTLVDLSASVEYHVTH